MAGRLSVRVRVVALMVMLITAPPIVGAWWLTRGTEGVRGSSQ